MNSPKDDKSEHDVDEDNKVAGSRAGKEGGDGEDDGSYVGRTFNDDALDDEVSGAEARSQQSNS